MAEEIAQIPEAAARFLTLAGPALRDAGARLRERDPRVVLTIARGSSDHAAAYLKYLVELAASVPVASLGPSVASVYGRPLRVGGAVAVSISQSGQSPDIVAAQAAAGAGGALTLALTNHPAAVLGQQADLTLPLAAGDERAVAATKTFVNSCIAGAALVAHWREDRALLSALERLPQALEDAITLDWQPLAAALEDASSAYILGRGPGFPLASEMALKLKETCAIHAEAFSAAEVLHGPAAIAEAGFPVLALSVGDAAREGVAATAARLAAQGAQVFVTDTAPPGTTTLPLTAPLHPWLDPLLAVATFYGMAEALSRARGHDPDRPRHLKKVTETR
ncbi:SIS domain-containing protein [Paracoccus suum]|uniref:SIS domain-containing protein n=2 Tax=Paracoccus suum TaxID=2259340 RepID=A0A344PP03_9RHOB|nr:SIS domain-containing protein [Paracoccus suum]